MKVRLTVVVVAGPPVYSYSLIATVTVRLVLGLFSVLATSSSE